MLHGSLFVVGDADTRMLLPKDQNCKSKVVRRTPSQLPDHDPCLPLRVVIDFSVGSVNATPYRGPDSNPWMIWRTENQERR